MVVSQLNNNYMNILTDTKDIIASVLKIPVEQLDMNAEMTDIAGWDSLRNVMILARLEEHFDVVFPSDDIYDLTSVRAFVDEITKLLN